VRYSYVPIVTDFRLSWWFIVVVDAAVESLHCVDMNRDADVLEVYAVSIFSVEVSRVIKREFIYRY
jgi:hypothetical protein